FFLGQHTILAQQTVKFFVGLSGITGGQNFLGLLGEKGVAELLDRRQMPGNLHAVPHLCAAGDLRVCLAVDFDTANPAAADRRNAGIETQGWYGNACARGRMADGLQPVRFDVQAVDRQANHRSGFALGEGRMLLYQPFSVHQIAFGIDVGENMLR
ncbi:MAG: hypothetical protein ACXWLD_02220, partial [Rhizomicrobium sp.]